MVEVPLGISVSGLDGSNDGWVILVIAVAGAGALFWAARGARWRAIYPTLLGAAAMVLGVYDWSDASSKIRGAGGLVDIGWGLKLSTFAGLALGINGLIILLWPSQRSPDERPGDES